MKNAFSKILDVSKQMIFICDKKTQEIYYVNAAFEAYVNRTREECIGKKCYELLCGMKEWNIEQCFCFQLAMKAGTQNYHNEKLDIYYEIEATDIDWEGRESYAFFMEDVTEKTKRKILNNWQKEELYKETKKNETRFRNAVSFANLLIWEYDPKTKSYYNDNGWIKEFGLEDCVSNVPESLFAVGVIEEESKKAYRRLFEDIEQGISEPNCEVWMNDKKNMQRRAFRINYTLEKDADGNVLIAHGIAKDITELKNAEEEYKTRMNSMFLMNLDAVSHFSGNITRNICEEGSSVYASIEKLQDKGSIDGFVEDAMEFIIDPKEQIAFRNLFSREKLLEKFDQKITRVHLEHHYLLEPEKNEWVRSSVEMVKNPVTGDIEAGFYTANIHRTKVMDNMFRTVAKREYDLIAAIYVDSGEYMIMDHKNDYITQKKYDYEEHQMARMKSVICNDEEKESILQEFNWKHILQQVKEEGNYILTFSTHDAVGKIHRKKLRYSYIDGNTNVILMTCRDITDLHQAEKKQEASLQRALEEAKQASQAKSEFLSRVSHDIRTPLNGITGMLQLAEIDDNIEQIHEDMNQASTSAEFLLGLINDILDMSKIEAGKIELQPEPYSFSKFAEYLDVVIRPLCQKRNLEFTATSEMPYTAIMVDKLRFNQIFFNLLSNSAKYTQPGGKVSFSCRNYQKKGDKISIAFYVKDNGIGMSEEFQKELFHTFTQEYRDEAKGTEGTGLGLAITKSLVDLMGGTISIKSKINQGTEFKVTLELPVAETNDNGQTEGESEEKHCNKKNNYNFKGLHILLCEDNRINQQIAIRLLERTGAQVDVASNGKEGVALFAESKESFYQVIIMDIRMPVMNGLEATRKIRALDRSDSLVVPIVAMTANALIEDKKECLDAGMNAHLMKPIDMTALYEMIENVCHNTLEYTDRMRYNKK